MMDHTRSKAVASQILDFADSVSEVSFIYVYFYFFIMFS